MCTCSMSMYEVGNGPHFRILWWVITEHPTVILFAVSAALLTTEIVFRRARKRELRQQRAYERQETVFYKGERENALLRPTVTPDDSAQELLRSQEYAPQEAQRQMLRAADCPHFE